MHNLIIYSSFFTRVVFFVQGAFGNSGDPGPVGSPGTHVRQSPSLTTYQFKSLLLLSSQGQQGKDGKPGGVGERGERVSII